MAKNLLDFTAEMDPAIRGVAVVLNKSSVLMNKLPIRPIVGLVEKYGSLVSDGGIGRRNINSPFPVTEGSKQVPVSERVEIAGAQCKTDVRMGDSVASNEIARRSRGLGRYIDKQLISGDGLNDQQQISGLKARLNAAPQLIDMAANGAAITLPQFEAAIDAVEDQGNGRICICNKTVARQIKRVILAAAGGATLADVAGGVFEYEGVLVIPVERDEAGAQILPFTETMGSSNVTSSLYILAPGTETDETGVQILMASNSIEVIPEGVRDSQRVDTVEVAFGLAIYHPRAAARLRGIKAA